MDNKPNPAPPKPRHTNLNPCRPNLDTGYSRQIRYRDGDPKNSDLANLEVAPSDPATNTIVWPCHR